MSSRAAAGPGAPSVAGGAGRAPAEVILWLAVALGVVLVLGAATTSRVEPALVLAAIVIPLILVAGQRVLLAWPTLLGAIVVVILAIPIRRYTIGGGEPIALEPYRVLIAAVLACWFLALAADPDVQWRPTGFTAPIVLFAVGIAGSLVLNIPRVEAVGPFVLKQLSFFASYLLVLCFVASVIRRGRQLDGMIMLLVGGGAIVAGFALFEWRTATNVFDDLGRVLPFLAYQDQGEPLVRGSGFRARASAEHPIAMGAALVMLIPLAVYLYQRTRRVVWLGAGALLALAALSTGSRTAAVMMIVVVICFAWLKRAAFVGALPYLLALAVMVQVVMPGTLGTFRVILNPQYVLQEQSQSGGSGSGRIADLGPSLEEWSRTPFFGAGFGTRIVDEDAGALGAQQILDNQWLGTLLEVGAIGVFALAWMFSRAIRRLSRQARSDEGQDGWLAAALAASITAFVVGMFTFDAFAFVQVTFLAFILLGFVAAVGSPGAGQRTGSA